MVYRDVPQATVPCPGCRKAVAAGTEVCPTCRSPIDEFRYARMVLTLEPLLKRARRWLAIAGGIDTAWFLFSLTMAGPTDRALGTLVVAIFFFISWALARRWPLGATLTVTSVFGILEVAGVVRYGPLSLVSGIVVKVLMVSALVRGVAAGLEIRSLRGAAKPGDRGLLIGLSVVVLMLGILVGVTMGRTDEARNIRSSSGMGD